MAYSIEDIALLETKSNQELFTLLGEQLTRGQHGIGDTSEEQNEEEGEDWWEAHLSELRELFCAKGVLRNVSQLSQDARYQLIIVIADAVIKQFTVVPPLAIATLLFRWGHERLCESAPPNKNLTMNQQVIPIKVLGDLLPACVDIINTCLLKREGNVQPPGLQGKFEGKNSGFFGVSISLGPQQLSPPTYSINRGALLSILDLCMEIASQPLFLPNIGNEFELLETNSPLIATRFYSYPVRNAEPSHPVLDLLPSVPGDTERQNIGWYLFTFALRFVALHEQGHYISGHLCFHPQHHLDEVVNADSRVPPPSSTRQQEQELAMAHHQRAMEIEADSFSFRNAALLGIRDWGNDQQPQALDQFLSSPADWCMYQFLGATIVSLLLSYRNHTTDSTKNSDLRTHPTPECRLYGLMRDLSYIRPIASQWHGDLQEEWTTNIEQTFIVLQVITNVLGQETATGLRSVLGSFTNGSPSVAKDEYEDLVRLLAEYEPLHAQARADVATDIGGPVLDE